jgi:hypothetical protein
MKKKHGVELQCMDRFKLMKEFEKKTQEVFKDKAD